MITSHLYFSSLFLSPFFSFYRSEPVKAEPVSLAREAGKVEELVWQVYRSW